MITKVTAMPEQQAKAPVAPPAEPPLPPEPAAEPPPQSAEAGLVAVASSDLPPLQEPVSSASPVAPAAPVHAETTIRGWFNDTFANLIATGRVRDRDAEASLQDLLNRLHL